MQLDDRFYKSTEVADLLGVSLRTLYRYMESDKIKSVHLPSGRHRFTKQQIEEFLYSNDLGGFDTHPTYNNAPVYNNYSQTQTTQVKPLETFSPKAQPVNNNNTSAPFASSKAEDEFPSDDALDKQLDDLLKSLETDTPLPQNNLDLTQNVVNKDIDFSATPVTTPPPVSTLSNYSNNNSLQGSSSDAVSPKVYEDDDELDALLKSLQDEDTEEPISPSAQNLDKKPFTSLADDNNGFSGFRIKPTTPPLNENEVNYFYCPYNDLRTVAKTIKKVGDDNGLKYAFTLNAGASLFFPLDPFSLIHFYIHENDLDIWKKELQLNASTKEDANIGILKTKGSAFDSISEVSGLKVASKQKLIENLKYHNLRDLADEVEKRL